MKTTAEAQIEHLRVRKGPWASDAADGMNGAFRLPADASRKTWFFFIVSDGTQPINDADREAAESGGFTLPETLPPWEHVSVHVQRRNDRGKWIERTPTWAEMHQLKRRLWHDHETVMQLHPPETGYVNTHPHCLHLWRPLDREIPTPPQYMV